MGILGTDLASVRWVRERPCEINEIIQRGPGNKVAILNTVFTVNNLAQSCYVTGKKNIRKETFPDTCGRGLKL